MQCCTFLPTFHHSNYVARSIHQSCASEYLLQILLNGREMRANFFGMGGSSGLVVTGGDSHSRGHVLESQQWLLNWHFFTFYCF